MKPVPRPVDPHSFFADPDPAAFQMQIRIQPYNICNKLLHEVLKKTKKIAQKLKSIKLVHIYLIFYNKI